MPPTLRRALLAAAVLLPTMAYLTSATRRVLGGDSGELSTLVVTGGAAHPPGYPLLAVYLHAMRWLPSATPAQAGALANAILGCAAAAMLVRACLSWGASATATAIAVLVTALSPAVWSLASQAEVFTLTALMAATVLWLASPSRPLRPAPRAVALAFVAGLSLATHYTLAALAPLGLLATARALRDAGPRPRGLRVASVMAACAAALLLGLSPTLWLFTKAGAGSDPRSWSWGDVHDARTFLAYLGRDEYADLHLAGVDHVADQMLRTTVGLLGLPLVVAAAVVAGALARRRDASGPATAPRRADWVALAASAALAGPVFAAVFDKPLTGPGLAVLERFDVLPMTVLAPACACALDVFAARAFARPAASLAMAGLAAAASVAVGLPVVRAHHRPTVELYARNALLVASPDAIVLGTGDHRMGAFLYTRYALGLRPDVLFVNPRMLFEPWYFERVQRAVAAPLPAPVDRKLDVPAMLGALLATGRPVFVTDLFSPAAIARFPSYPVGPLIRLRATPAEVPSPDRVLEENEAWSARFEREPRPWPGPEPWGDDLVSDYARPWLSLADAFAQAGDPQRAASLRARGQDAGRGDY